MTKTTLPKPTLAALNYRRGFNKRLRTTSAQSLVAEYRVAIPAYDAGWLMAPQDEQPATTVRVRP